MDCVRARRVMYILRFHSLRKNGWDEWFVVPTLLPEHPPRVGKTKNWLFDDARVEVDLAEHNQTDFFSILRNRKFSFLHRSTSPLFTSCRSGYDTWLMRFHMKSLLDDEISEDSFAGATIEEFRRNRKDNWSEVPLEISGKPFTSKREPDSSRTWSWHRRRSFKRRFENDHRWGHTHFPASLVSIWWNQCIVIVADLWCRTFEIVPW